MNFRNTLLLVAGVAGMMIGMRCSNPVQTAGNGSNVGNGMVTGLIVDENGNGVKGVTVYLRKRSMLADITGALLKRLASTADTVITNDIGKFVIDSIDTGTYVIEGVSGDNLCLNDSIAVTDPDSTVILPPDTLKPAGAIKGIMRLSEDGDPRKVFVLAFGIDRFARIEASGAFKFNGLAEGKYDLRLISSLDNYGVLDTLNISVISADTTDLDTIDLPFTGIPTPKNVSIAYDTLKQIVTLSWGKVDTSLIKGFNVYRRDVNATFGQTALNGTLWLKDTVYADSTGSEGKTYEYKVTCIDKKDMESPKSAGVETTIASAYEVDDVWGTGLNLNYPMDMLYDRENNLTVVLCSDNRIVVLDSTGLLVSEMTAASLGFDMSRVAFGGIALGQGGTVFIQTNDLSANSKLTQCTFLGEIIRSFILVGSAGYANGSIEVDTLNRIWYASNMDSYYAVRVYDSTGTMVAGWPLDSLHRVTRQIFVDKRNNNVYLSQGDDVRDIKVRGYDQSGRLLTTAHVGNRVNGIFVDDSGHIIALSSHVGIYEFTGELLLKFGSYGIGLTYLNYPTSILVDNQDRVIISDAGDNKIKVFRRK